MNLIIFKKILFFIFLFSKPTYSVVDFCNVENNSKVFISKNVFHRGRMFETKSFVFDDNERFVLKQLQFGILKTTSFKHQNQSLYIENIVENHQFYSNLFKSIDKNGDFLVRILQKCEKSLILEPLLPWTSVFTCSKKLMKNNNNNNNNNSSSFQNRFSSQAILTIVFNFLKLINVMNSVLHCDWHRGQLGIDKNFNVKLLDLDNIVMARDLRRDVERKLESTRCHSNNNCKQALQQHLNDFKCNIHHQSMFGDANELIDNVKPSCEQKTNVCRLRNAKTLDIQANRIILSHSITLIKELNMWTRQQHHNNDKILNDFEKTLDLNTVLSELKDLLKNLDEINENDRKLLKKCLELDVNEGEKQCRRRIELNKAKFC